MSVGELLVYLYTDNGLVASTQLERLQREFDVLTGLFNRVGLSTNTRKTVRMLCQPCHAPGLMSLELYVRRATGMVSTFRQRQ